MGDADESLEEFVRNRVGCRGVFTYLFLKIMPLDYAVVCVWINVVITKVQERCRSVTLQPYIIQPKDAVKKCPYPLLSLERPLVGLFLGKHHRNNKL